jgi:RNA polymerase sporulation-specific sigma factor
MENDSLITENMRLVWYLVRKFNFPPSDVEDFASCGFIGLIKAARTFDVSKGIKFATYASRCINNEILMEIRRQKPLKNICYLDDVLNVDYDGNELTLKELLPDESFPEISNVLGNRDEVADAVAAMLNRLSVRERQIILARSAGLTQRQVAERLQISQSYASRLEKKIIPKMRDAGGRSQTGAWQVTVFGEELVVCENDKEAARVPIDDELWQNLAKKLLVKTAL